MERNFHHAYVCWCYGAEGAKMVGGVAFGGGGVRCLRFRDWFKMCHCQVLAGEAKRSKPWWGTDGRDGWVNGCKRGLTDAHTS